MADAKETNRDVPKTFLKELNDFLEDSLNKNTQSVRFNLAYLFHRDQNGFFQVVDDERKKFQTVKQEYIPGMFGVFTSDPNKPLNFEESGLLGKSGTTTLLFALPDKDDNKNEYFQKGLLAIEEFENNYAGKTFLLGANILPDKSVDPDNSGFNVEINTFVVNQQGAAIKWATEMRTLVGLTISIIAAKGIPVGGMFEYEIVKGNEVDENTQWETIEVTNNGDKIASTPDVTQGATQSEASIGIRDTLFNRVFFVYYAGVVGKELLRRAHDPSLSAISKNYLIRTTLYRDGRGKVEGAPNAPGEEGAANNIEYQFVRSVKFMGSTPTTQKGSIYGGSINFGPREIKNT